MIPSVLSISKIAKMFSDNGPSGDLVVLKDISLEIKAGEFFVMVGPSGCGKSTLLRVMSGLEKEFKGTVAWGNGVTLADVSFVFQQFALMPWLTVAENIELSLTRKKRSPKERAVIVKRELNQLGLSKFANAHPRELSGGMRQRVGLARALACDPKIIFMDEPFSEVDSFTAESLRTELLRIWEKRKMTVIMVTHLVTEAIELADRIAVLTPRPGRIEKILTNNLTRPRVKRSPEFYALEDTITTLIKP